VIFQQLLNGLVVGGVYSLFALGFALVFGIHHILNLAHGGVFMTGAFLGLYAVLQGLPLWLGFVVAALGGGLLSVLIEFMAFRPLKKSGETEFGAIISSIGANLIIISIAQKISQTEVMRFPFETFPVIIYRFWGLRVSFLQLFMALMALALMAVLLYFLYRTPIGRKIRAVAGNEHAAILLGVNPNHVFFTTFFLSGALAGVAGVLIGLAFNSIHFMMGEPFLLSAFVICILGGMGSIVGTMVGGLVFGMIHTLSVAYLSSGLTESIIYGLLFVMLILRPNGLFGKSAAGALRVQR
jgi:branched-chain amino acid transport system permease protein